MTSSKSPSALRTIGEVAEEIGVAPHVLRFWESKFHQIKPQKRRGRRYYRPDDIKFVTQIKSLLYGQGYTIKGAQKFLSEDQPKLKPQTKLLPKPSNQDTAFTEEPLELKQEAANESVGRLSDEDIKTLEEVLEGLREVREALEA